MALTLPAALRSPSMPLLSVIIPLAPQESAYHTLLPQLKTLPRGSEIILISPKDAPPPPPSPLPNPTDHTLITLHSKPGRGPQMNAGARHASGKYLWFLHADTHLTNRSIAKLMTLLAKDQKALFYFDLTFHDDPTGLMCLNALGVQFRSRLLKMPFGDQGLCISKALFDTLGGYDENLSRAEDHAFVWHARHHSVPLVPVRAKLSTSARKYTQNGWLRTTLLHLCLSGQQAWPEIKKTLWRRQ